MGLCRQSRTQHKPRQNGTYQHQWQRFLCTGRSLGSKASSGQVTSAVSSHAHQPSPGVTAVWQ